MFLQYSIFSGLIIWCVGCASVPDMTYYLDNYYESREHEINVDKDNGKISENEWLDKKVTLYETFSGKVRKAVRETEKIMQR